MKGDFSRWTFRPKKRYTAVLLQQGRVVLDADWNEQLAIQKDFERMRFEDVVGSCAVPNGAGFLVQALGDGTLSVSPGRIYAGAFLCVLDAPAPLSRLMNRPIAPATDRTHLLYLDAWERHLTALDDPDLLEPALAGVDTSTRVQVAWKLDHVAAERSLSCSEAIALLPREGTGTGTMRAAAPNGYRGFENHLFRVEIHDGGSLGEATFKWSRDNGSVAFAVEEFLSAEAVRLAPGQAPAPILEPGDWVEVSGEESELAGLVGTLARVEEVRGAEIAVDRDVSTHRAEQHPRARRWDQRGNRTVPVSPEWIELESGIKVRFSNGTFRPGDYWQIPARPAGAPIEWPADELPSGVEHRFCPLALISWKHADETWEPFIKDCRPTFATLTNVQAELTRLQAEVAEMRDKLKAISIGEGASGG